MNRFVGFFRRAIVCGGVLAVSLVLAGIAGGWLGPDGAHFADRSRQR